MKYLKSLLTRQMLSELNFNTDTRIAHNHYSIMRDYLYMGSYLK